MSSTAGSVYFVENVASSGKIKAATKTALEQQTKLPSDIIIDP